MREVRVAAAGIRQDEHARAFEAHALQPEADADAALQLEQAAEYRDADKRDDRRLVATDFATQNPGARDIFLGP